MTKDRQSQTVSSHVGASAFPPIHIKRFVSGGGDEKRAGARTMWQTSGDQTAFSFLSSPILLQ